MKRLLRPGRLASASVLAMIFPAAAHAQWAPPIGIPHPSFGITQHAPPVPSPWVIATPGYYYVEATSGAAADSNNPYGTPARPRRSIPRTLPAGAVVELHGTYDESHTSPATIVSQGTAGAPVYIRGPSPTNRPFIRSWWEVKGSYIVMENLEFGPASASQTGGMFILAPGHHITLRASTVRGNVGGGGLAIGSWTGAAVSDVVLFRNKIHDNGDVHATYDQDVHGIQVGNNASSIWVLENELYRNSGDGIQISAGGPGAQATTHHIYVGRNTAHDNKQAGFWSKQAVDVIFSENESYNHRPSDSSPGQCMGYQYAPERIWFLFNRVHDCDFGIMVASDNDLGSGTESYFIGNVIYRIHTSVPNTPGSGWSNAGITMSGGLNRYVVGNTIYDVDAGVNSPSPSGSLLFADNIVANVAPSGHHLFVEMSNLAAHTSAHHNLLQGSPRFRLGGGVIHLTPAQLAAMASVSGDPKFIDPTNGNLNIPTTSPAVNAGELNSVYDVFLQRYGIGIAVDALGRPRTDPATDIGAYLAGGVPFPPNPSPTPNCFTVNEPPGAPTALAIVGPPGATLTLKWNRPSGCAGIDTYNIEGALTPQGPAVVRESLNTTETTVTLENVSPIVVYVRVLASNRWGMSPPSNEVQVGGVPAAPTGLTATLAYGLARLAWSPPATGPRPTGYLIEGGWGPGRTDASVEVSASAGTSFTAPFTVSGTFHIRVRSVNSAGHSAPSNEIAITNR